MPRFAWWGALTLLCLIGTACGDPCGDPEDRQVLADDLPCSMTNAEGVWESHPLPPIDDEDGHPIRTRIAHNPGGRDWPPVLPAFQ